MISHLGIKFSDVTDVSISATMPVDPRTRQPMGLLHGGASVVLAETLGSFAAVCCLDDPSNFSVVGIEINANHLKSVRDGHVVGIAKPVRLGRKLQVWNINIYHADEIICTSRLTVMVVANKNNE